MKQKPVIEIRCLCGERGFMIRPTKEKFERTCGNCLTTYVVRTYSNGAVTVHYIKRGMFAEELFPRERWSRVDQGE